MELGHCRGSNLNRWGVKGGFRVGKLNFFNSIMCYYEKCLYKVETWPRIDSLLYAGKKGTHI